MAEEITIEQIQAVVDSTVSRYTQPIEQRLETISAVISSMYSSLDRVNGELGISASNQVITQSGVDKLSSENILNTQSITAMSNLLSTLSPIITSIPSSVIEGTVGRLQNNILSSENVTSSNINNVLLVLSAMLSEINKKANTSDLSIISNDITVATNDIKASVGAIQTPPPADISLLQSAIAEVSGNVLAIPDRVVKAIPKQEVTIGEVIFDDTKVLKAIEDSKVVYSNTNQLIINSTASVLDAISNVEDGVKELNNTIANSEGIEVDEFTEF